MIRTVTIDFWNTLYDSANGPPRNEARRAVLRGAITDGGLSCENDRFEAAYTGLWEYFDHHWLERQRTPTSHEMVVEILRRLELDLPESAVAFVAEEFARGVLEHPPALLPGAPAGAHGGEPGGGGGREAHLQTAPAQRGQSGRVGGVGVQQVRTQPVDQQDAGTRHLGEGQRGLHTGDAHGGQHPRHHVRQVGERGIGLGQWEVHFRCTETA